MSDDTEKMRRWFSEWGLELLTINVRRRERKIATICGGVSGVVPYGKEYEFLFRGPARLEYGSYFVRGLCRVLRRHIYEKFYLGTIEERYM